MEIHSTLAVATGLGEAMLSFTSMLLIEVAHSDFVGDVPGLAVFLEIKLLHFLKVK